MDILMNDGAPLSLDLERQLKKAFFR